MCERFFKENALITIPKKQKDKEAVFERIITLFEFNRIYNEKEINEMLGEIYPDYALIRRYLVDSNLLQRDNYGEKYQRIK
ncbi:DUF2087 domain-containing protein [Vagococcus silagei]|uniref:DUF2087 domain-containing protein n=1 Tax=Vagococcus silagei TaxID=2508885 RepID=A0A4S3B8N8_9ENTE|nr:DUF2087 domain-containing protein [Vagococcus silagei]THB62226.1 DUF2087 domain-containing protein [Vagococcus silagei]